MTSEWIVGNPYLIALRQMCRDTSAVGNGKQRKARSADREPHDYCGRPVL